MRKATPFKDPTIVVYTGRFSGNKEFHLVMEKGTLQITADDVVSLFLTAFDTIKGENLKMSKAEKVEIIEYLSEQNAKKS